MKLHEWTAGQRGRAARLARFLGVEPPVVSDWCTEAKQVPLERCVPIEQFTEREVTCEELRPDRAGDFAYLRSSAAGPANTDAAPANATPDGVLAGQEV